MLRFQTIWRYRWIIQKNAVSDEQPDSIQKIQNHFRSGKIGTLEIVNKNI
jgi:hypothetical protein